MTMIKKTMATGRTKADCIFLRYLFIGLLPSEDLRFIDKTKQVICFLCFQRDFSIRQSIGVNNLKKIYLISGGPFVNLNISVINFRKNYPDGFSQEGRELAESVACRFSIRPFASDVI